MAYPNFSGIEKLRPLDDHASLRQGVANRIREAIMRGDLPLGARLLEQKVAEQLGISRMPVREAIQQLTVEGWVVKKPRRGTYVYTYSAIEVEETYSLRVVLERFIVQRVLDRCSECDFIPLEEIVNAMNKASEANDGQQLYGLDCEFHEILWSLAEHKLLLEFTSGLRSRISRFMLEANNALSKEETEEFCENHCRLVTILKSGNVSAAQEEISRQILMSMDRINANYGYLDEQTTES